MVWGEPISGSEYGGALYNDFLAFDHRAAGAKLQPVARFDEFYCPQASCDGLLLLATGGSTDTCFSICNPATREYRLLLRLISKSHSGPIIGPQLPERVIGCHVLALCSDQPPKHIQEPVAVAASELRFNTPTLVRDSLHWFPSESSLILVFDTATESFRQICAPFVRANSNIFEMDGTLGIQSYNDSMKAVDIWVLQNYPSEVWKKKYRVELPIAEIRGQLRSSKSVSYVGVVSVDSEVLLLLSFNGFMFYVNTAGELVGNFHRVGHHIYASDFRIKQTLVQHSFFMMLEGYAVNASPFL